MSSNRLDRLWADYQEHHRTSGNKYCHMTGIPLIIVGLLGLLGVPLFQLGPLTVNVSLLVVLAMGAVYVWLDARLGAAMIVASLLLWLVARMLSWQVALAVFAVGWMFQFIGHGVYEKRSPAFYKNLAHLVVGPLWVLNHLVHLRGERAGSPVSTRS